MSDVHRSPYTSPVYEGFTTIYHGLLRAERLFPKNPFYGVRPILPNGERGDYAWQNYEEIGEQLRNFGTGLIRSGILPPGSKSPDEGSPYPTHLHINENRLVGIFASNQLEWVLTDYACASYGWCSVPLYDSLSREALRHILTETRMRVAVVDLPRLPKLLSLLVEHALPPLAIVVIPPQAARHTGQLPEAQGTAPLTQTSVAELMRAHATASEADLENLGRAIEAGTRVHLFDHVARYGRDSGPAEAPCPPEPSSALSVVYTSGTKGPPKGAILTHENFIVAAGGWIVHGYNPTPTDRHLSYLPLAHVIERTLHVVCIAVGGHIGFWSGTTTGLISDIAACQPSIFVGVPRIFDRIHAGLLQQVAQQPWYARWLFRLALRQKLRLVSQGRLRSALWDRLVFGKIQTRFGGRLRLLISGGAPMLPEVQGFFKAVLACDLIQGYGMTESASVATLSPIPNPTLGDVGLPCSPCEVKLVRSPDSDLPAGQGEVWVRGPNFFKGYFHNPEKTAEVLVEGGWYRSGDAGRWTERGHLEIMSRLSDMTKLPNGEFICPELVEGFYLQSPFVAQCYVHTDAHHPSVAALVVPDAEALLAQTHHATLAEACVDPAVEQLYRDELLRLGRLNAVPGYAIPRRLKVLTEAFDQDNNLLTPTMKLRRRAITERYADILAALLAQTVQDAAK